MKRVSLCDSMGSPCPQTNHKRTYHFYYLVEKQYESCFEIQLVYVRIHYVSQDHNSNNSGLCQQKIGDVIHLIFLHILGIIDIIGSRKRG